MSVGRDVYLSLVGWYPTDRLLDGRLVVGLLTILLRHSFQQTDLYIIIPLYVYLIWQPGIQISSLN